MCSDNTRAKKLCFDWGHGGRGKTTSIEEFVGWKSPLEIPKNKVVDHKKCFTKKLLRIKFEVKSKLKLNLINQ